jgi:hypothetical protein
MSRAVALYLLTGTIEWAEPLLPGFGTSFATWSRLGCNRAITHKWKVCVLGVQDK